MDRGECRVGYTYSPTRCWVSYEFRLVKKALKSLVRAMGGLFPNTVEIFPILQWGLMVRQMA